MTTKNDREKYKKLSEPFETDEQARAASDAFAADVRQLREKHRIADVVLLTQTYARNPDDSDAVLAIQSGHTAGDFLQNVSLTQAFATDFVTDVISIFANSDKQEK